jgi:DNA polymerase III, delta subunit
MKDIALHPQTAAQLESYVAVPSQAVLLVAPAGAGKALLARELAERILDLPSGSLENHGYALVIRPDDGKAIGVETVRELERFLSLKVPGKKAIDRAVIIEDAHRLTLEAQNALLKTLEEPPAGTVLILTATHGQALLPTVHSRLQSITVRRPGQASLAAYFQQKGFDEKEVRQVYAMSGGLPGLMQALLADNDHPLRAAAQEARQLLSQPLFERLVTADALSKRREVATDTIDILQQMAHIGLQSAAGQAAERWKKVLAASYEAADALQSSAQLKLVLTDLALRF